MTTMTSSDQHILNKYMNLVEAAKQGETKAMDVATEMKPLIDGLSELYDELKDQIIEERSQYNDKEQVIRNGYEIRTQSRTYYQYKQDDSYDFLQKKLKHRKDFIKKATNKGESVMDPETGESIEPVDVKTTSYPVLQYVGDNVLN